MTDGGEEALISQQLPRPKRIGVLRPRTGYAATGVEQPPQGVEFRSTPREHGKCAVMCSKSCSFTRMIDRVHTTW